MIPRLSDEDVRYINGKLEELWRSRQSFSAIVSFPSAYRTRIEDLVPRKPGVYVIDDNVRIIYVGSTGKNKRTLADRLRDLFYCNPNTQQKDYNRISHTLTYKLVFSPKQRIGNGKQVREFYRDKCSVRYVGTENVEEARLLEDILIRKLKPSYNG